MESRKETKVNIVNLFLNAAVAFPNNQAIIEGNTSIDYKILADQVKKTAAYFYTKGIREGDRVLVFVPMSVDLYRIVLALFHIGAAAVFLDEWVSKERLLLCCKIANCKGFVGTPKARLLSVFAKDLRRIPIKLNWRTMAKSGIEPTLVDPDTTALITFTTGSTGIPKAADRSHTFLGAQFDILKNKINAKSTDVDMPILPIVLFVNLGVGATSVIAKFNSRKPDKFKPQLVVEQIKKYRVTRLTASPFVVKSLGEHLLDSANSVPTLKNIFTGGAPVFPSEAAIYTDAFPDAAVVIIYGSTEAEPISAISASELVERKDELKLGLPVGKVHPLTKIKVIGITEENIGNLDESGLLKLELGESKIGEVIVSGDHVLKKYYDNPEAFAANKIVVGNTVWHRTGDSGKMIDGQLYLTGRCKQLIKTDGEYISPFIVENRVQEIEGIGLGTILEYNGGLVLVLESNKEKEWLKKEVRELKYDTFITMDVIPRDPRHFSKIDYPRLIDLVQKLIG